MKFVSATCPKGHERIPWNGRLRCRVCYLARKRRYSKTRRSKNDAGRTLQLAVAGQSDRQSAGQRSWVTRRERFGETGLTDGERQARSQRIRILNKLRPPRTACFKGHPFTAANTIRESNGVRRCRTCRDVGRGRRPQWIERDGARISVAAHDQFVRTEWARLRDAMIASHPDKGGKSKEHIKARTALERFLDQERRWYAAVGLELPSRQASQRAAA